MLSTLWQSLEKARKEACNRETGQICADMNVLARSRATGWQKGRVLKTVTKGNKNFWLTTQRRTLLKNMKIDTLKGFTFDSSNERTMNSTRISILS